MLAAVSTGKAILIGVASAVVVLLVAGAAAAALRRPRRAAGPDIPPGMRPGPSDPDLEKPLLERLYAAGLILVVIMALWVPAVFLRENVQNKQDTVGLLNQSIQRGHLTTLPGTEANQLGFNCQRCHGPGLGGGQNVYNGNVVQVPNLQTVCGGEKLGHPLIKSLNDIIDTISQGRTGTDMPSWSVRFAGAMDDQQINDLVNYILSIQKVPAKDNVCLNPAAS
jgi:Cytochrome C oxidase, cbb3-type, subunit III